MKKLMIVLGIVLSASVFNAFGADLYEQWVAKIKETNMMKELPKVELCHIKNLLEGKTSKFNDYVKGLEERKAANAKDLKALGIYVKDLNEDEDDIERLKVSALNGVIKQKLQSKKWTCPQ